MNAPAKPLGNHNRCWIWGQHAVGETLRAGRWPILELVIDQDQPDLCDQVQRWIAESGAKASPVPQRTATRPQMDRLLRTEDHQGLAARMSEYPYLAWSLFEQQLVSAVQPILVLDRLQDPFNFGAILRCGEVLGVAGVVVGEREQAGVSSQVARSSAGAVNHLSIVRVPDLSTSLLRLKSIGWSLVGASEKARTVCGQFTWPAKSAIVIGNEGRGIAADLQALCDDLVVIPQQGTVSSLNAAVSAGILLFDCHRHR